MNALAVVGWPVLDRIPLGPLSLSPHGVGIAVGYLAGAWWMVREGRKRGVSEEDTGTILLWALIGAIVGARFFYVIGHWEDYSANPIDALKIWEGGISLVGGIAGAIMLAYPLMRRFRYRFLQVMDSAAIGLAFGIAVGRIGDLVIGDHLGKPTNFFLGWVYRGGQLPGPWQDRGGGGWQATLEDGSVQTLDRTGSSLFEGGQAVIQGSGVHQTALYDLLIALGLFLFLRWLNRRPRREGVLILTFAIWYGAGRIVTDFLRIDKTYFDVFTGSQLTAIAVIVVSILTLLRFARRPLSPDAEADDEAPPEDRVDGDRDEPPAGDAGERPTTAFVPPTEPGERSPGGEAVERDRD